MKPNIPNPQSTYSSSDFLKKLKGALGKDGDFPASARLVSQIQDITSRPETTTQQVAELILREPTLGARVLHLVNSSFYGRSKPILTVSQAVIQIGMRPIAELCTNLVLLQKFIPLTRRSGPFAQCFQRTITTSLLTSMIATESREASPHSSSRTSDSAHQGRNEAAYLAGTFGELGLLLISFYFPKLFDSAKNRAASKGITISKGIQELVGLTPIEISLEVLQELNLPTEYQSILQTTSSLERAALLPGEKAQKEMERILSTGPSGELAQALFAGGALADAFSGEDPLKQLETAIIEIDKILPLPSTLLTDSVQSFIECYDQYCSSMEVALPPLPDDVVNMNVSLSAESDKESISPEASSEDLSQFIVEVRTAVEQHEPLSSIITTVMETLAWSLKFERVLLLLFDKKKQNLTGRMALGDIPDFEPKQFVRPFDSEQPTDNWSIAIAENRLVFTGEPLLSGGRSFVLMPVGFDNRRVGLIYGDRVCDQKSETVSEQERGALQVLMELLNRAIALKNDG